MRADDYIASYNLNHFNEQKFMNISKYRATNKNIVLNLKCICTNLSEESQNVYTNISNKIMQFHKLNIYHLQM